MVTINIPGHQIFVNKRIGIADYPQHELLVLLSPPDLLDQIAEISLERHEVFERNEFLVKVLVKRRFLLHQQTITRQEIRQSVGSHCSIDINRVLEVEEAEEGNVRRLPSVLLRLLPEEEEIRETRIDQIGMVSCHVHQLKSFSTSITAPPKRAILLLLPWNTVLLHGHYVQRHSIHVLDGALCQVVCGHYDVEGIIAAAPGENRSWACSSRLSTFLHQRPVAEIDEQLEVGKENFTRQGGEKGVHEHLEADMFSETVAIDLVPLHHILTHGQGTCPSTRKLIQQRLSHFRVVHSPECVEVFADLILGQWTIRCLQVVVQLLRTMTSFWVQPFRERVRRLSDMLIPPFDHQLDVLAGDHRTITNQDCAIAAFYLFAPDATMIAAYFGLPQELDEEGIPEGRGGAANT